MVARSASVQLRIVARHFNIDIQQANSLKGITEIRDYQGVCISYSYHNNTTTEGIPHFAYMESAK